MNQRTLTAKTGKPVNPKQYVAFLPNKEAEREHADMFKEQDKSREDVGKALIERLLGLR